MMRSSLMMITCLGLGGLMAEAADKKSPAVSAESADADFALQGEYAGEIKGEDGPLKIGVQVIALGGGKFRAVPLIGGLPGAGWNQEKPKTVDGQLKDGAVRFPGEEATGVLRNGQIHVADPDGNRVGTLNKVVRKSPTLGLKAPQGAVTLFDGSDTKHFKKGRKTADGLLMQGTTSVDTFQSFKLHLEFMLSYMPQGRGQGRSNSGCYMQGRYEVQILDSFGLSGEHNECGGIYSVKKPDVNMCLPPLSWQTYDIQFTAAKFDNNGKKTANARMTVKHNGVLIHNDVEVPKRTTASPLTEGSQNGPIYLQDHGNPLRFRNIWVLPQN